jgi:iron complex outermembrane receptor protein
MLLTLPEYLMIGPTNVAGGSGYSQGEFMTIGKTFVRALLCASVAIPAAAMAQSDGEAQSAPAAEASSFGSGEIVVTAQRRAERLQDIPASISALDSAALAKTGVLDITNIAPRVPGFYAGGFGTSRPQLYIRGIGTRQFDPGSESSVGVFVDESYLGRTGAVLGGLKDVERVEVLKGPQGTLYGRNTIGGAINVLTKRPTDELSAEIEGSYGNYDYTDIFGAVSGPIAGDALKGRIAVWRSKRDGYVTNLTTGNHPQGLDNWGGRLRFEINPADNVKIDLIGEIMRDKGRSFQGESVGNVLDPTNTLLGNANDGKQKPSDDPYKQYYTTDPTFNRHIDAFTGKVDIDLGGASLVSVTSYRKMKYTDDRDFDNTSNDVIRQITSERSKQFTQEVRLVSEPGGSLSFGGLVDWIVGVYYYHDKSFHSDTFDYGPDSVPGEGSVDVTFGNYKTTSIAAFGQATFHITSQLDLTLGARYTEDRKRAELGGITNDAMPLVPANFLVDNPQVKFTSFDPKITLSYKPNRDINLYATYSQGFKSGGYQYTPLSAAQASEVFQPEEIDAYEVGIKTVWGGGLARVNAAAFYYDYKNLQVSTVVQLPDGSTPSLITNAGTSEIKGAELEVTLEPVHGLTLSASYAYTDAKYEKYLGPPNTSFPLGADFGGTRMVRAPKHSINLSGEYVLPLNDDSDITFRADYAYTSKFYHEPGEGLLAYGSTIPLTVEDGYGLLNGRITYNMGGFYAAVWGRNITDKLYRKTILALPGQVINLYGEPRTYGLTIGYRY